MVPSAFVLLQELPLTAHGKVDRRALPAPDVTEQLLQGYVEPQTPTELALAQIWCEALTLERVGINDNFFDLGGHSLLATQIIAKMREVLRFEVPIRLIFEAPTIQLLAMCVDDAKADLEVMRARDAVH
jgi:acyl carrier protein